MDQPEAVRLEVLGRLDAEETRRVALLAEAATETDGVRPLSEHVALHLRHGGDAGVRHVLAYAPGPGHGTLVGYAHLDATDLVEGPSAELVVHPRYRGQGYGSTLVEALLAESSDGRLRLWAHGLGNREDSPAGRLAWSLGFRRARSLWQMRRSLRTPIPAATLPAGVRVRTFRPGQDDEAWLRLNSRAFANHPEQGHWSLVDLHRRMAERWFDPPGFFLAERVGDNLDGQHPLVGFHWTKVHGSTGRARPSQDRHDPDRHGHEPIGEVYVVGVDPDERGTGLGRALTAIGLRHLRDRGLAEAMLYVDADNAWAIRVYERLGFTRWDTDVMFVRDRVDTAHNQPARATMQP
ncbi:MAG: mycothiol synthase [Actinomycetes bacterium]